MHDILNSERPIIELENKIAELKKIAKENAVDLTDEIDTLSKKVEKMKQNAYENLTPWQKVRLVRLQERPTSLDYIKKLVKDFIEFHGDRFYGDDSSIVGGIGIFEGIPITVIGHQKGKDTKENIKRNFGMPHPEGYRKALRLMKQAEKFKRPVLTFIDTPGAYCGPDAEERGQGEAIALNLIEMSRLKTPIISIVIGEGGSGGALGLGVADRICMLENSIYSVISPEGLASILWKDAALAQKAAGVMKLTAQDLLSLGIIDNIIKEPPGGAHKDINFTTDNIKSYVLDELKELVKPDTEQLLNRRYNKIREIGIWA
ncbi:MAG: acetyl-CoA carboxylase carboxyltransferase subunit alpha [Natronincolaceae bacterium]|nr:acetyl-CoA carboxylase carboxyltransferase subunit alpha [Bacillota bacterium]NLK90573.1 acetyl-CoA carboxylase carboxyltransferase subunit alpha [Clostridiales bacterium]